MTLARGHRLVRAPPVDSTSSHAVANSNDGMRSAFSVLPIRLLSKLTS